MDNLERFVIQQNFHYATALKEIKAGHKRSHWIWFIFPQLKQLGRSSLCQFYGIQDINEARAYMQHPILRGRLQEITEALLALPEKDPSVVMGGWPDDQKLCSCMTLFAYISEKNSVFHKVLHEYFHDYRCEKTIRILEEQENASLV